MTLLHLTWLVMIAWCEGVLVSSVECQRTTRCTLRIAGESAEVLTERPPPTHTHTVQVRGGGCPEWLLGKETLG